MLRLLDVQSGPEGPLVASLDVTGNVDQERAQVLADARDLYGPGCLYYWHDCGHDESASCARYPAE